MSAPAPKPVLDARLPDLKEEELAALAHRIALARLKNEGRERDDLPPLPLPLAGAAATPEEEPAPGAPPPEFAATPVSSAGEPLPERAEGAPPLSPRTRYKLKLWQIKTTVDVELNADTGELMAWRDPRLAAEEGGKRITETRAIEIARDAIDLPDDCGYPDVVERSSGGIPSYEVSWVHLVGPDEDVVVEGDKVLVRVNATTGRVHSVFRKWRKVGETPPLE